MKYYVIFFAGWERPGGVLRGTPVKGSERLVLGAVPLSSAGFRGGDEALGVSLLGTRKRTDPPYLRGFRVRELWGEEG